MAVEYSSQFCCNLKSRFNSLSLHRPPKTERYEPGEQIEYDFEPIESDQKSRVKLQIEKFVGGGFAGQVYKVKILEIDNPENCPNLHIDKICAIKILIPPSGFSKLFRNCLYWIGFGGPFQLQVNPAASKAGALWQKFIRKAAEIKFGDENCVVDIYGTFIDKNMGSCGEISEWIEGRTWWLEVDDHIDLLKKWRKKKRDDITNLGSPEYRAKHVFMHKFVELLHEVGAHEFARQYEWTTLKSQPNCLKRLNGDTEPDKGLVAVDFRAGLALLAFLPMSPGDVKLILQGLARGTLVQFDRGNLKELKNYIDRNKEIFGDCGPMYEKLVAAEEVYRNSLPDITHNHVRLLYSKKLWKTIFSSAAVSWKTRNTIDQKGFEKLSSSKFKTFIFFILGLVPIFGRVVRKFWCYDKWRKHYVGLFTNFDYLKKSLKAKVIELAASWHRAGRVSEAGCEKIINNPMRIAIHLPFLLLIFPAFHRLFTDFSFAKNKIYYITVRPIKLYFNADMRRDWLLDMVQQGRKKHILTDEDAETILARVDEPFIQKYLKSLAVHVCTLPVTQIVSVAVAGVYWMMHPDMPKTERSLAVGAILIAFQIIPISPGSIVRGLYVVYMVIKDKNFKDYNIAVFLGFFKYVGYLAFPIQMTYRYPAMARFMAAHWATEAVHIVPVFGEGGALLEHTVFCWFYNWPLTIRNRLRKRAEARKKLKPRKWHILPVSAICAAMFATFDLWYFKNGFAMPPLTEIWPAAILIPFIGGALTTIYCGRAVTLKRAALAAVAGLATAIIYSGLGAVIYSKGDWNMHEIAVLIAWRCFVITLLTVIGAIITELSLPDVGNKKS